MPANISIKGEIPMNEKYFDIPTQVHFFVPFTSEWCYGIAYHNEIICACCGGIFELDEVESVTKLTWIGFAEDIADDTLPFGAIDEE